jgi:TolB-like protein
MLKLIFFIIAAILTASSASAADPSVLAAMPSRTSIIVLPFESPGGGQGKGAIADDYLMEAFAQQKRFTIVEREKLEKILLEQKLSREKMTEPEHSIRIGKLLTADQLLYGRIDELNGETVVTMRMVSTSTSASRDYSVSGEVAGAREFRRLISEAASRVEKDFPLLEGRIVGNGRGLFKASFTGVGLRKGLEVTIYRWGEEVRHPATGKMLGRKVVIVAGGTIATVDGGISSITLAKTEKGRKVKNGDLIITR